MMLKDKHISKFAELLRANVIDEELQMDETLNKELAAVYEDFAVKFRVGKVVSGRVVSKDASQILVSIDYKSDGFIPNYEFSDYELKRFNSGDEIEVMLDRLEDENGYIILSYQKAKALKAWDKIAELAEQDQPVTGVVTHKVKGGLNVDIGIPAFLPGSQVDVQRVADFDQFVGQEVTCKILKVNKKRGNVILSRRRFIEEQRSEDKKKALETIQENQIIQGIVKNITSYGVFVDVGGIDGLLHITDMSWGRIGHPSELVRIGDTITVKVISFDKQHEKISLGMKQLTPNPWENIDKKYPSETKIKGKISSITDYGLFVEVEKGVEGLIHISEISWIERINNLSKHFSVGQDIEAVVVALDKDNRRMSLSIKKLSDDPWKTVAEKFKPGEKISGKITNITDFGLFVQLLEGVDGLVHISDISWTEHIAHPGDKYKKGDVVQAVILSIDVDNRKVSLGIKQLENDPWTTVAVAYPTNSVIEGSVSKITSFGAFIKLESGIEGLVHISELSDKEVAKVEDVLKVGQVAKFKVIKVSPEERKLGLSLRALIEPKEQPERPAVDVERERAMQEARRAEKAARYSEAKKSAPKMTKDQPQAKSSLQQALEAHAAKMKSDDDKSE
jgi:small subunit ribosomal protein S1